MALSDSQTALKSLYMTYFGPLMRFTGMYVSSPAEAEEIVSDTFLAIWNNRKQLPGISNFDSYIYTVARHKAISYYRKQHMEQVSLDEISIDLFTSTETTPEEELISQEGIHRLNLAIDSLPAKCKMAFKLVREDKLKYKRSGCHPRHLRQNIGSTLGECRPQTAGNTCRRLHLKSNTLA